MFHLSIIFCVDLCLKCYMSLNQYDGLFIFMFSSYVQEFLHSVGYSIKFHIRIHLKISFVSWNYRMF